MFFFIRVKPSKAFENRAGIVFFGWILSSPGWLNRILEHMFQSYLWDMIGYVILSINCLLLVCICTDMKEALQANNTITTSHMFLTSRFIKFCFLCRAKLLNKKLCFVHIFCGFKCCHFDNFTLFYRSPLAGFSNNTRFTQFPWAWGAGRPAACRWACCWRCCCCWWRRGAGGLLARTERCR